MIVRKLRKFRNREFVWFAVVLVVLYMIKNVFDKPSDFHQRKFEEANYDQKDSIFQLVQACLRAPHVVADEAKLAIVFFFLLRLLLFTHFGETPVAENLFPPIFWQN